MGKPRPLGALLLIPLLAAGCTGVGASLAPVGSSRPPAEPPSAAPSVALTSEPSAAPSAVPPPAGLGVLTVCHDGATCLLDPGTWMTGPGGFLPGLKVTLPADWYATEQDSGEFSLRAFAQLDNALLLWKDVHAVQSHHVTGNSDTVLDEVGTTPAALVKWLTTNKDFAVLSPPKAHTLADGTKGTLLTVGVGASADFGNPDCPDNPHCAAFWTDPLDWGGEFFAIGGDETVQLFLATLHDPAGDHTVVVAWDAPSPAALESFTPLAKSIFESLDYPETFVSS